MKKIFYLLLCVVFVTQFSCSTSQNAKDEPTNPTQNRPKSHLTSTNDQTDRTSEIMYLLNSIGICILGPGEFYVKNIVMPEGTTLKGCGYISCLVVIDGGNQYCGVQLKSYCTISDLQLVSSNPVKDNELSSNAQNKHGILWKGNYSASKSSETQPFAGIINNVHISGFAGGGITCDDTGYGTVNCVEATNCYVSNCNVGINIKYWSEYHKFTNIRTSSCYYGCVNNGGNNMFVNCDFSSCKAGFLMNNKNRTSPNNSHGSAVGCIFNHTNGDKGTGIEILNCPNGFIFTGCQIFFSQIHIEKSQGIVISDSNFGKDNCDIQITNSKAILFTDNSFGGKPKIKVDANSNVTFVNCYSRTDGSIIEYE